jgi:hypothetical protein
MLYEDIHKTLYIIYIYNVIYILAWILFVYLITNIYVYNVSYIYMYLCASIHSMYTHVYNIETF